jgi:hypothetical protein
MAIIKNKKQESGTIVLYGKYVLKDRHDKKAFRFSSANPPECGRLINALLALFDMHLSKRLIRLKVPSGEYGLSFVAFNPESFRDLSCLSFKL